MTILVFIALTGIASASDGYVYEDDYSTATSAVYAKGIHMELTNGQTGGPESIDGSVHRESGDGTVDLDVDYDLDAYGKVTGDGEATIDAHVRAEGSRDPTTGELEVETEVESSVYLKATTSGTAEGRASATGSADATLVDEASGTNLTAHAKGSTAASGKVMSPYAIETNAGGTISTWAWLSGLDKYLESYISAGVMAGGAEKATSSATGSASGEAWGSILTPQNKDETGVFGTASGSLATKGKSGGISVAGLESVVKVGEVEGAEYADSDYVQSEIYAYTSIGGDTESSVTANARATTTAGKTNYARDTSVVTVESNPAFKSLIYCVPRSRSPLSTISTASSYGISFLSCGRRGT